MSIITMMTMMTMTGMRSVMVMDIITITTITTTMRMHPIRSKSMASDRLFISAAVRSTAQSLSTLHRSGPDRSFAARA